MSSNWESHLTPQEIQAYGQFFSAANGNSSNVVNGQDAVTFFARSGIPNEILSDIWETADRDNSGYLTPETFSVALKLIACAQHGHEVAEPILSTVVALPQFKGFNLDATSSPDSAKDIISAEEREKYLAIFRAHHPAQGVLDAEKARGIFSKSKLPNDYLAQIWNLADVRKSGNLNQTEFVIAMHYVARLMDRTITTLPAQLPAKIYGSAAGSIQSSPVLRRTSVVPAAMVSRQPTGSTFASPIPRAQRAQRGRAESIESLGSMAFSNSNTSTWDVTPQEKIRFDMFFDQIDTKRAGIIQGSEAVNFFKNSHLPDTELARVWDLADIDQNGQLTRNEFAVAMHLIQNRLTGKPLPNVLPKSLIPPPVVARPTPATPSTPQKLFRSLPSMAEPAQPLHPPQLTGTPPPQEDLLGDFGDNEELTTVTNAVNQLQYQISNVQTSTSHVTAQKDSVIISLEQGRKQKEEVKRQTAQIVSVQQAEGQRLADIQSLIKAEEPGWLHVQQEHDAAQQQLDEARTQLEKLNQSLAQGRTDSEQLRQRVHRVQEETAGLVNQLERLRMHVNKTAPPAAIPVAAPGLSFDDIFSPSAATLPAATTTLKVGDDFDALFSPQPPAAAAKRQPPPPPPPSRRTTVRRQETPQATKKSRAPPPPPPSTAATASVATTGVAVAAVAHEADHNESDTTTSSDTESASDDTSSPMNETATREPTSAEPPLASADIATKSEEKSDHIVEKILDTTVEEAPQEPAEKEVETDLTAAVVPSDTAHLPAKMEDTKSLDNETEVAKVTADVTAEGKPQELSASDAVATPASPEISSDTTDQAKMGGVQSLDNVTKAEKTIFDVETEAPLAKNIAATVTAVEGPSDIIYAANVEAPRSLDDAPTDYVPANETEEPIETVESPSKNLDNYVEAPLAAQDIEPPKEQDRVTSEVLADTVMPEPTEAIASGPVTGQDIGEAEPKENQGTDNDEKEPLQNPESNATNSSVSAQNSTAASGLPSTETVLAPVPESAIATASSIVASKAVQDNSEALPKQERVIQDFAFKPGDGRSF